MSLKRLGSARQLSTWRPCPGPQSDLCQGAKRVSHPHFPFPPPEAFTSPPPPPPSPLPSPPLSRAVQAPTGPSSRQEMSFLIIGGLGDLLSSSQTCLSSQGVFILINFHAPVRVECRAWCEALSHPPDLGESHVFKETRTRQ